MPGYWPHTEAEIAEMLGFLGLHHLDELFEVVPGALRLTEALAIAPGRPEPDVLAHIRATAAANEPLVCFAGGGAYDHEIPPVTAALASRSEFVTSYTPYQAEVAQGVLQAVFEFQTLVSRLTGMDVANASLYDGAAALSEAVNLAVGATGRSTVWVSDGVNPAWRSVLGTLATGPGHRLLQVPLVGGQTAWELRREQAAGAPGSAPTSDELPGALLVAYPNYLGCLEDLGKARRWCDQTGALLVVAVDPIAAGILRSAGSWGADVVVGEGQALGLPLSFGGPYLGLFACRQAHLRRLPGRLVGETVDNRGQRAYVTTLRTREQDIRREKATSNVCTNQTLMAITAAIQLGWLGSSGLAEVATRCAQGTRYCRDRLLELEGVTPLVPAPVVREFALHLPIDAALAVDRLAEEGLLGGIALGAPYSEDGRGLLVAVTERRTRAEIDRLVDAMEKVLR